MPILIVTIVSIFIALGIIKEKPGHPLNILFNINQLGMESVASQ